MDKEHFSIYKITCNANNKVYIGQTSGSVNTRFKQHLQKDSNCIRLKRAIKKYGKENFIVEEIDIASNREEALRKEADYIKQYQSNNIKYGYNILANGHSSYLTQKVYCIETQEIFETVQLAAKTFGVSFSFMAKVCRGKRPTAKGLHFTYMDENNNPIMDKVRFIKPNRTKVRCIETGEVFDSVAEAARCIGRTDMTIFNCLKGKAPRAGGYHWEYLEQQWHKPVKYTKKPKARKVRCIDTGEIFSSATEAGKSIGVSINSILGCCNGRSKTSGGKHWEYLKEVA